MKELLSRLYRDGGRRIRVGLWRIEDECWHEAIRDSRGARHDYAAGLKAVREGAKARKELQLIEEDSDILRQSNQSRFVLYFAALIGLVPGWIVADFTLGTWSVLVFCPLSSYLFVLLMRVLGFKVYRPRSELLRLIEQGEAITPQVLSSLKSTVEELEDRLHAISDELHFGREVSLSSTSKVDVSSARSLGTGPEWVYAYSFPSQIGGQRFPIKVGMTSRDDVVRRIDEQLSSTGMHERARVLLLFRVSSAREVETMFHRQLKKRGRHKNDAVGKEWFKTSPQELIKLYHSRNGE